jgi:hypothetical protein
VALPIPENPDAERRPWILGSAEEEIFLSAELHDSAREIFFAHFDATFVATNIGQLASKSGKPGQSQEDL